MSEASDKIATGLNEAGLEKCPFCAGTTARMFPPNCLPETPYNPTDRLYPIVSCGDCGASVSGETEDYSGKTAITAWNRRATPEAALPVGVKGLEWSEIEWDRGDGSTDATGNWEASSIVGIYVINISTSGDMHAPWEVWGGDTPDSKIGSFETLIEAKAAAQADYEARIRSALIPAQVPVGVKRWAEGIEAAARVADAIASDDGDRAARGFLTEGERACRQAGAEIAAAIRALIPAQALDPAPERLELIEQAAKDTRNLSSDALTMDEHRDIVRAAFDAGWDWHARMHPAALSQPERGKAEPREGFEAARHWIDRYASGIDEAPQMNRIAAALSHPIGQPAPSEAEVDWLPIYDAAIAEYEAVTPKDYRYSATALRRAIDAAFRAAKARALAHPPGQPKVAGVIPNSVLDAVAAELRKSWGVGVVDPKPKPIGWRSEWREIARPIARAALAALQSKEGER